MTPRRPRAEPPFARAAVAARLAEGLAGLAANLPEQAPEQLVRYLELLHRWNRAFNLTAVRDPLDMVSHHVLDSLAVLGHLQGARVLDVGTGAGLPGIPLALARPATRFTLLDSVGKKTRFVRQAVAELGIGNVRVQQGRVADFRPEQGFDVVICRAFGSLAEIAGQCRRLCDPAGRMLAMKGACPPTEIDALPEDVAVAQLVALKVPLLAAARHLVVLAPRRDRPGTDRRDD